MLRSTALKDQAINLRKTGLSYREINKILNVPKTTLSDWLHSIKLTPEQKERLKNLGGHGQPYASEAHKKIRLEKTQEIFIKAKKDIKKVTKKDLWYMGIMLYWAEGTKQKEHNPSTGVIFSNSDPNMIRLFLEWIKKCLDVTDDNIEFSIYIHTSYKKSKKILRGYWSEVAGFPVGKFDKIYYKRNKVHSYRKNRGVNYYGVLRIRVRKSTNLNRQITGWVKGICLHCGIV